MVKGRLVFCSVLLAIGFWACSGSDKNSVRKPDTKPERIIGIQPFGNIDLTLADTVSQEISRAYGMKTVVLEPVPLPQNAFVNIRSPRYRADTLIRHLQKIKPAPLHILMGLTDRDISVTKCGADGQIKKPESKYRDFGIFGLGFCPGPSSVVSVYRYQGGNRHVFYERFFKIAKHEIGHNLGLPHCPDNTCVMRDAAESMTTIDHAGHFLCDGCKRKLTENGTFL